MAKRKPARLTCDGMHLEAGVGRQQAVSDGCILAEIQIAGGDHSHNGAPPEVLLDSELVLGFLELGIVVVGVEDSNYDPCLGMSCGSAVVRGQNGQLIAIPGLAIQRSTQVYPAGVGEYPKVLGHIRTANGVRDIVHSGVHNPIGDPGIVARVQIAGINLNNLKIEKWWSGQRQKSEHGILKWGMHQSFGTESSQESASVYLANLWRTRFRCQRYEVIL